MGIVHVHRGRLAPAILLLALVVLAAAAVMGLTAGPASAQNSFTTCASCHSKSATHTNANHAGFYSTCTTCHNDGGTSNPPLPSACGACHGGTAAILASAQHTTNACGTTPGCHGVPSAVATTTMTAKVAPTSVQGQEERQGHRYRRSCRLSGRREGLLQGGAQGRRQVGQDEDRHGYRERDGRLHVELQDRARRARTA